MSKQPMLVVLSFGILSTLAADDTIPGGNVSGTWYAATSPYYITGNITIPANDTLIIEPGVLVNFLAYYRLTVNGWLGAEGTEVDSIYFTGSEWNAIHFSNAPDTSRVIYCDISGSNFGIACSTSNPVISHTKITAEFGEAIQVATSSNPHISDCRLSGFNGIWWKSTASGTVSGCTISGCLSVGVNRERGNLTLIGCIIDNCDATGVLNYSLNWTGNLTLIDCTISNDTVTTEGCGGGVRSAGGTLDLINCTISDNYTRSTTTYGGGGGVYCEDGTVTLTNCTISRNCADHTSGTQIGGGGIGLRNANATLSHCTIFDNWAAPGGGGIETYNSSSHSLIIDHCTIDGNQIFVGFIPGNGIVIRGSTSTADVTNSTISNNYGQGEYAIYNEGTLTVEYSDFYGNDSTDIGGNIPTGFGILDTTNYNGDSCDVYTTSSWTRCMWTRRTAIITCLRARPASTREILCLPMIRIAR